MKTLAEHLICTRERHSSPCHSGRNLRRHSSGAFAAAASARSYAVAAATISFHSASLSPFISDPFSFLLESLLPPPSSLRTLTILSFIFLLSRTFSLGNSWGTRAREKENAN